jgi:hypothetical protein
VCIKAAQGGSIEVMRYLVTELAVATPEILQEVMALATPEFLQDMLAAAGTFGRLAAAQWLRQQGADWPPVLQYQDINWSDKCLAWARQQGCTAPTVVYDDDDDNMY